VLLPDREAIAQAFPLLVNDSDVVRTRSTATLPLSRANGEPLGALTVGWSQPRQLDPALLDLLADAADIVARTSERLEVIDLERSIARTLQLGLLALDVRSTAAVVRARYQAAESTMEIGGDWYDAVDLGEGRLAVAVGDVVGRGLAAATTMGQLRAALGITSLQASDAGDAVRILDRYAHRVAGAACTTVAFAILDSRRASLSYLRAGHPPPLLVTPTGDVRFLEEGRSWPLGVVASDARTPAATADFPGGSLLLLYTDGLVERRGRSIDHGLDHLRSVVQRHWALPLRRLKQAIFGELVDDRASDDIALVAVRSVGASPDLFVDAFNARATELGPFRHRLRGWLTDQGYGGQPLDDILLGVGEAAANSIDHGSDEEDQVIRVEAARLAEEVMISVSDSGRWQSGIEGFFTGRGRGHMLMRALADDVDVETDQHGSIVTLRFARQPEYA
jgi:serine phosphatase RsbU (regulator of sigma subunit)/anti-sigma regulatory factor (Ser/Thr protein kinase)